MLSVRRGEHRAEIAAAGALLAVLVLVPLAGAARGETLLISRASGAGGVAADGSSYYAAVSSDGRYVAFESDADNLSAEDDDTYSDVFVRDAQTGQTLLASRANGASGAGGNGFSNLEAPGRALSGDGRYVAFASTADNLSAEDDDNFKNIFVRDVQTGTTTLVSRTTAGAAANDSSGIPAISTDGRYVAFQSAADNLSPDDNNAVTNIFVRDLLAGTVAFVSRAPDGGAADASSVNPSISADGRYVVFDSAADNLSPDDQDAVQNVFVRDTQTGATIFVSRATGASGPAGTDTSSDAFISPDGRYVAFQSLADNLSAEDNDAFVNIFVRDLQAATTTLASRTTGASGAGADGIAELPVISSGGRNVAFQSNADNLSAEDNNTYFNVFVRDLQTAATTLASRAGGPAGAGADNSSFEPGISADGRFVAFSSDADNLSGEDDNAHSNIFRRDILGGPPRCSDTSANALHNTSTPVSLTCVDDDGDAVTRVIVSGPAHGTLGAIDQAAGTVTYTPANGYSGPDSFTFRATDATGTSNVSTASVTVASAPARPQPPRLKPGRCANPRRGTRRSERLNGTRAGDRILGLGGNDVINGLAGADCLLGGLGRDRIAGGTGDDRLEGGAGDDRLTGGAGRNSYIGGAGRDTILAVNRQRDTIDCGTGKDTVRADRRDRVRRCERVGRTRR